MDLKDPVVHTDAGEEICILHPDPQSITLSSIARALSKEIRWGARFVGAISVAKHSVICATVAKVVAPNDIKFQMDCLIHDAAETYLIDVPSTVKDFVYFKDGDTYVSYHEVEDRVLKAVYEALGVPYEVNHARVKNIDLAVRYAEYRVLKNQPEYSANVSFEDINDALDKPIGVSAILASVKGKLDLEEEVARRSTPDDDERIFKYVYDKLLGRLS